MFDILCQVSPLLLFLYTAIYIEGEACENPLVRTACLLTEFLPLKLVLQPYLASLQLSSQPPRLSS